MKKDGLPEKAQEVLNKLKFDYNVVYDDKDAVGRRYRRQDAMGTPFCITVDNQTKDDGTVTLRYRDSMEQERVSIEDLESIMDKALNLKHYLAKMVQEEVMA